MIELIVSLLLSAGTSDRLRTLALTRAGVMQDALIVGRTVCGTSTWLLTESPTLFEIRHDAWRVEAHPVRGLQAAETVWGLACLTDGTLWTLATPRIIARMTSSGEIVERIAVSLPRVALFGAGDQLLYQQMPMAPGAAALASSPAHQPHLNHSWPGLIGRSAPSREQQLTGNLVNCGIGVMGWLPCWFANERSFAISNGERTERVDVPPLRTSPSDRAAPIWDIALAGGNRFWLLASAPPRPSTRPGGERLHRHSEAGSYDSIDLPVRARLIVATSAVRCVLLTTRGGLLSVEVAR